RRRVGDVHARRASLSSVVLRLRRSGRRSFGVRSARAQASAVLWRAVFERRCPDQRWIGSPALRSAPLEWPALDQSGSGMTGSGPGAEIEITGLAVSFSRDARPICGLSDGRESA